MKTKLVILAGLFLATVGAQQCTVRPVSPYAVVGVDPTLTWAAVTTGCAGPISGAITYNVYRVSGSGPIPTAPATGLVGCPAGTVVQRATGTPLNATAITALTYNDLAPEGIYTYAVEAVSASGVRGALSSQTTVTVANLPTAPANVVISWNETKKREAAHGS